MKSDTVTTLKSCIGIANKRVNDLGGPTPVLVASKLIAVAALSAQFTRRKTRTQVAALSAGWSA